MTARKKQVDDVEPQAGSPTRRRDLLDTVSGGMARRTGQGDALVWHPALEPPPEAFGEEQPGKLDRPVFATTALVVLAFVVWGGVSPKSLSGVATACLNWVVTNTGWLFALAATGFVFFVLWLAFSRYGRIPLGRDGEDPEFSTVSWVAMMFSAGMGIGLMFYGVAEPLAHFTTPPPGTGAPGNDTAAQTALATTLFHWGLHPWAIYAVAGISIAYGVFRKGRPLTISAVFEPLIGHRQAYGPGGKIIDIFAIFATLFGSATSLGLGALQIAHGMQLVGWVEQTGVALMTVIIVVLTICFIFSAVSGVSKGIQWLSNINMVLAVALALFIFVVGPTVFILNLLPTTVGTYIQELMAMSARTGATTPNAEPWLAQWTIFYWAWWASWTPFVGMFIARISRGRTIRQFVGGVLLLPTLVSVIWFAIFGGAGIETQRSGTDLAAAGTPEGSLFELLQTMPWWGVTSIVVMTLVAIFFVSGADAASIVMGTLSENGTIEPSRPPVIFWGVATGAVAVVMLMLGGEDALSGLQTVTIVAALPFLVVLVGMCVALVRDLSRDPLVVRRQYAAAAVEQAVVEGVTAHGDDFQIVVDVTPPGKGAGAHVDTDSIPVIRVHAEVLGAIEADEAGTPAGASAASGKRTPAGTERTS